MGHKPYYCKPKLDYHDVKRACFEYAGKSYPVATAPTSIFQAAVLAQIPKWEFSAGYRTLLSKKELDLFDRWYLLNCLADKKKGIVLQTEQVVEGQRA